MASEQGVLAAMASEQGVLAVMASEQHYQKKVFFNGSSELSKV